MKMVGVWAMFALLVSLVAQTTSSAAIEPTESTNPTNQIVFSTPKVQNPSSGGSEWEPEPTQPVEYLEPIVLDVMYLRDFREQIAESFDPIDMDEEKALIDEYKAQIEPPPPVVSRPTPPIPRTWSGNVEQWRPLVEAYFPAEQVPTAMRVMACESGGNPSAVSPTDDHGLMQHHYKYWVGRSTKAGYPGGDVYDPTTNVAVAAWLWRTGGWTHWTCY